MPVAVSYTHLDVYKRQVPAQYLQIALDLATRIAQGELAEGSRIYGRSVLASEYGVSPETIRKALRLLADMKVVDVKPQSGAVAVSYTHLWTPTATSSTGRPSPKCGTAW